MEGKRILELKKLSGTPGVIRTPDPLLRRQVLYPAELRAHTIWPGRETPASQPPSSFARVGQRVNIVDGSRLSRKVFMI